MKIIVQTSKPLECRKWPYLRRMPYYRDGRDEKGNLTKKTGDVLWFIWRNFQIWIDIDYTKWDKSQGGVFLSPTKLTRANLTK